MKSWKYIIIAAAAIICAVILARAYTYKYRVQDRIVVTGLGETEFTSDMIVWKGYLSYETTDAAAGYAQLERNKEKVLKFITSHGIPAENVIFNFVYVNRLTENIYNSNGHYIGERHIGYNLRQEFTVESSDVDNVESISREISALIAQGVNIDAFTPDYYYTKLDDVKLDLIEQASADARTRAEKIALHAGARIGRVASAKMGVFQITGANSNEEFSAGGSFNTSSRNKKARITMRIEYRVK